MIARMLAAAMLLGGGIAVAQTAAGPAFEVASVRLHKEENGGSVGMLNGRYWARGTKLQFLIGGAYGVRWNLVSGLPGWAESTEYDVEAKIDDAEAAAMEKMPPKERYDEQSKMIRALLAERFHLQVRRVEKVLPQYELVIAKSGLKMKEAGADDQYEKGIQGAKGPVGRGYLMVGGGTMTGQAVPFATIAANLEGQLDRRVVDKTGLTGNYDVQLQWTPDSSKATDSQWPSFFTALEEQLGLKLAPSKGMTQTLVVEHVERPTEN